MINLFEEFQVFRRILCVCPCCGEIVRVSDLKLKVKGPSVRTWLDDYNKKIQILENRIERWDDKKEKLKDEATERGRKQAETAINKIIPLPFKHLKIDPFDVKPILNPVDFIIFKGMSKKEKFVDDIMLLSKTVIDPGLNKIREQIKQTVMSKNYEWQVARINEEGKILFES